MSATNLTKNLKLSQFVASDKPSWLGDVNGDNKKIDDGYGVLAGEISKANDTASSAKSQSDANTQTLTNVNSELEDYGNRITALEAGGGTEQLEQRVNTLDSDIEALQTRADTFEENITQNGTNITSLTERMAAVEGKATTNKNNITSLTGTVNSLNESIQSVSSTATQAKNDSATAKESASTAQETATNALNLATTANMSRIDKIMILDKMTDIASNIKCDNIVAITTPNDSNMPCVLFARIYTQTSITSFPATLFTTNSGSFPTNVKKFTGDFHEYNDTVFHFEATVDSTGALRFTVNRTAGNVNFGSNREYNLYLRGDHEF